MEGKLSSEPMAATAGLEASILSATLLEGTIELEPKLGLP